MFVFAEIRADTGEKTERTRRKSAKKEGLGNGVIHYYALNLFLLFLLFFLAMDEEADGTVSIKLNVTALTHLVSISLSHPEEQR